MSRRRDSVPGPVGRLFRERGRSTAIALVALSALAVAGIQGGAAAALRASLDESWRGVYDILVVPADAAGAVDGMLPPNSLASGTTGLTIDDLAAVRGVDGVGVAAPIGELIVPAFKPVYPAIAIPPDAVSAEAAPQAFRVYATFTTDDGLGERVVTSSTSDLIVEESSASRPIAPCQPSGELIFNDLPADPTRYPALAQAMACAREHGDGVYQLYPGSWGYQDEQNGVFTFSLTDAPQGATRITLIDPLAEKELLGAAGAFLDPLIAFAPGATTNSADMLAWARTDPGPYGQAYLDQQVRDSGWEEIYGEAGVADVRRLYAEAGRDFDAEMAADSASNPMLPLLVSDANSARLSVKLTVESFGDAVYRGDSDPGGVPYAFPTPMTSDAHGAVVGTVVSDISGALNPFVDAGARVAWPGADLDAVEQVPVFNSLNLSAAARPVEGRYTASAGTAVLQPSGYRSPLAGPWGGMASPFALDADPARTGTETAYVGLEELYQLKEGASTVGVPIGSFTADGIDSADAVDYVPLGAYAPIDTTVTGGDSDGAVLAPSVTGLGLVSPQTIAIGSLDSAAAWGDESPISAIRVRVEGIDGYTAQAQQKVVDVASALQSLGFRAVVVAGSSPSAVAVQVDGYAFGVDSPDAAQQVRTLGEMTQRWSELGAAARAELAISGATFAIALIGVGSAMLLLGAVQLAGIPRRRAQAGALREVGFTRMRTVRWFAAEELPGALVITTVAIVAVVSSRTALTLLALTSVVGITLALGVIAVVLGARPAATRSLRRGRSRRTGARTVSGFGARQAWLHPVTSLTQLVAVVIVGAATAALVAVFTRGRAEAGQSLLASLLSDQQLLPQLVLGTVAITAGVALALLGRRLELGRRAGQWSTLRSAGWTSRQIARAQRTESVTIIVPALVIAIGVVASGTQLLDVPQPWLLTAVAAAAATIAAVVTLTARTRGTPT